MLFVIEMKGSRPCVKISPIILLGANFGLVHISTLLRLNRIHFHVHDNNVFVIITFLISDTIDWAMYFCIKVK